MGGQKSSDGRTKLSYTLKFEVASKWEAVQDWDRILES
jgi:hypothetical protein